MKKLQLVFIPLAASSHQTSALQFAKRLLQLDENLNITFLLILPPIQTDLHLNSECIDQIRFTIIPPPSVTDPLHSQSTFPNISIEMQVNLFFKSQKPQVEFAITELLSDDSTQLVGFVLDMFCTCMIDVADKFKIPSYIFLPFNRSFLGFLLHLPIRHNRVRLPFDSSDSDSVIPSYQNLVPTNVLPSAVLDKTGGGYEAYLYNGTRFQESKGIIVNSFVELEPHAINSIVTGPPVYPVGPLFKLKSHQNNMIMNWLTNQPPKSVVFLCFGSTGYFNKSQLEQMAIALERSNHGFLWSIRLQQPANDSYQKVLPDVFLERVKERGMVCGWAPQVEVLAHGAVKGFVSHCGWNSILESLWYGVPIATWPLNAEQQLNAFLLVKELGLGVELSLSYRSSWSELVMADEIERAICLLMDDGNPVRERVKEVSNKGRNALMINGVSSFVTLEKLVQDMLQNINGRRFSRRSLMLLH